MPQSQSQLRADRLRLLAAIESFLLDKLSNRDIRETYLLLKATTADTTRYLSLSQEEIGKVSYAERINDRFSNRRRRRTTIGRYIRRQLAIAGDAMSDHYLAELQNAVISQLFDAAQFITVVSGDAIRDAYDASFGMKSCMTGTSFVNFYVMNPDRVSMVKFDNGATQARALLWTTDQAVNALDRVYPTDGGSHIALLQAWARAQGFRVLFQDDCRDLTVTMIHDGEFPYLDNFSWGRYLTNGRIILGTTSETGELELRDTSGGVIEQDMIYCSRCDNQVHVEDSYSYNDSYYCDDCWHEFYFCCFECEEDHPREDGTWIEDHVAYLCDDCAGRLASQCVRCSDYVLIAEAVLIEDGRYRCADCPETEATSEAV